MKQFFWLLLCCLFFSGCGKQEESSSWQGIPNNLEDLSVVTDRTEYYDISVVSRQFNSGTSAGLFLGTQFYQGEPIELRLESIPDENNQYQSSVCIHRIDGSREILMPYLDNAVTDCYLGQDGACYSWVNSYRIQRPGQKEEVINTSLTKYLSSGEIQFTKEWNDENRILDIRQLSDGKVYLSMEDFTTQEKKILELNTDTGETTEVTGIAALGIGAGIYLGESDGSLALYKSSIFDERNFIEINPEDGSETFLLSLNGTSYSFPSGMVFYDFQVKDDGSIEILWADRNKSESTLETLHMNKIEETPVILRGRVFPSWLLDQVTLFNQYNEKYHVIPEPCGIDYDSDDFARLTSIQLSAGKGPDILYGEFMQDYLIGMIAKGSLEDLSPFLDRSGIRKEDYFSLVFSNWNSGSKIYGINVQLPYPISYKTSGAFLGNLETVEGEALIDALLSNEEEHLVYLRGYDSQALLNLFLSGSDSLLGLVNWENGSCSFSGDLFQKLLEAAKRYGDDGKISQDSYPAEEINFLNIFEFDSQADLEKSGMMKTGILFDDGCHAAIPSTNTMAVNANSSVKEGAWEFLSFLLSQEIQSKLDYLPPVRKDAFDLWLERERSKVSDGQSYYMTISNIELDGSITTTRKEYTEEDLTDEKVDDYIRVLDEARPYPIRTIPILNIIKEEAVYYFNGSKTAEEVGDIITNRVQLYLDESR